MPRGPDIDASASVNAARAHVPALDGLRGIAILLVIPHNADIFSNSAPWLWPIALIAHAGWIGVQLFFVLSGFLITRNLLDTRRDANYLRSFYVRRALRIFPLYFLTLFVGLVVLPHFVQLGAGALASHHNQIWLWTFLSNWAQPYGLEVSGFSHFWSLAVEEQFYLVWPFVVLFAAGTRLFWVSVVVAFAAFVSRVVLMQAGASPEMLYMFTNCRMDALALGAAGAALSLSPPFMQWLAGNIRALYLSIFGVLVATALFSHSYSVYDSRTLIVGQTLLACAFALLIVSVGSIPSGRFGHFLRRAFETRWLRTVGRYSFAMYVFHMPILVAYGDSLHSALSFAGSATPLLFALSAIVLSFLAGLVSYHLLEKHFLRLKPVLAPH
jgi:peptidoglycan/LPS O-acetylase OafA/YrhL